MTGGLPAFLTIGGTLLALAAASSGQPPAENIALGCSYRMSPAPSYALCTDPGDSTQLTDGVYTDGYFWAQQTTVGWQGAPLVVITIDLGKTQPISGVSYSTAAGVAQVAWPTAIRLAVSEDGRSWRSPGDLISLSWKNGSPPAQGYGTYRYVTRDLASRGRYVRLAVVSDGAYVFCDEVEVYHGPDELLTREPRDPVTIDPEVASPMGWSDTRIGVFRRLSADLTAALVAVDSSKLPATGKAQLRERLDSLKPRIFEVSDPDPTAFRAVFPLNDTHARILSAYGPIMQAQGLPAFFAWRKHRYDPLGPNEVPEALPPVPKLEIALMKGEFRADAFLLTNASEQAATALVRVEGLAGAPKPSWLSVSAVPWTDTAQRIPVAAALPDADYGDGAFHVPVPAGMTCKVWLTVDSTTLTPGNHEGFLAVEAPGYRERLPFAVRVSAVAMGRPRLSLGMWDYTDGGGAYGITPRNAAATIEMERSHFVDSPWAQAGVLPWPAGGDFDVAGDLQAALSFEGFDQWVRRWPGARNYLVFAAVGQGFADTTIGTPEFAPRVASWAKALAGHMRDLTLEPRQLGLLLVDEPYSDEQDATIAAWARAIKAGAPEITVFEDPVWERPDQARTQDALTLPDILCPNIPIFYKGGAEVAQYFEARRVAGQRLWLYQCSGPARLYDPSRYHRLEAWHAFRYGAVGIGFWAFGDTGGGASSWNEYAGTRTAFTPAFIGVDDVTDGIHWQAVREGLEDYEYLAMLRDAAAATTNAGLRAEAERLLAEALEVVIGDYKPDYAWATGVDRSAPDIYRLRVLALLERMR